MCDTHPKHSTLQAMTSCSPNALLLVIATCLLPCLNPVYAARLPASMSIKTALGNTECKKTISVPPDSHQVTALYISSSTPCTDVTVSADDADEGTANAPIMPVVIENGGTLTFKDETMTIYASSFFINAGGVMQAGGVDFPIQKKITIVMAGNASVSARPMATGITDIVNKTNDTANARDITVMDNGELKLYGGKGLSAKPDGTQNNPATNPEFINIQQGTNSWTYLARPAGPISYSAAANVSAPATSDNTLTLATTVDWQADDWVSVATTSFSSHQTEIVKICGITNVANPEAAADKPFAGVPATVSQLTLCQSLKHYHYGGLAPTPGFFPPGTTQAVVPGGNPINVSYQAKSFYDSAERNYGIDERAEVALLSRNIKLTSLAGRDNNQTPPYTDFFGGHLAIMTSSSKPKVALVGVEIEKFGQPLVGRYPVHLHLLNDDENILIQDVSVHHGYNKCFVVHGSGQAKLYNNVCVRTVGQGVYLEDGSHIAQNQFIRNFVAGTMAASSTYSDPSTNNLYWDGDNLQNISAGRQPSTLGYTIKAIPDASYSGQNSPSPPDGPTTPPLGPDTIKPSGFWITNLGNTFVNNSVAGCQAQGRGYWLLSQSTSTNDLGRYAYPEFTGNRVHGCHNGIDTQPDDVRALNPQPTLNGSKDDHPPVVVLNENTITRSRNRGFWGRGMFFTLHDNRLATNLRGFSLLGGGGPEGNIPGFWGLAHDNVIAGFSRNNVERFPGCLNQGTLWITECTDVALIGGEGAWGNYPDLKTNIQGYSYYDGPARIEHNRFVNFRVDPTGAYPNGPAAARLLTLTDKDKIPAGYLGQLSGEPNPNTYVGYMGDPATGWIQSNQQAVPPTQYTTDSIWENVDFKHQVYTAAVNMGPFNDGDKNTVIIDRDGQLAGYQVVNSSNEVPGDVFPISLNNLDFFATDFTVDEPHSRGRNNFTESSLISPHKYATLNLESVTNPVESFRVEVLRDMPAYGTSDFPSMFLNGRGQKPIYEPFVMDRMGYTLYGKTGTEDKNPANSPFMDRLLLSYTDPPVKSSSEFFANRIGIRQAVADPSKIKVYRIRRQWGQKYISLWPPAPFIPPGAADTTCDGVFFANQDYKEARWADCLLRAKNQTPYNAPPYTTIGKTLSSETEGAAGWIKFNQSYTDLIAGRTPVADFIENQTFYYDSTYNMLYFYIIEDRQVHKEYSPFGTCNNFYANKSKTQQIKSFSDPYSLQSALDVSCLVSTSGPQMSDIFTCDKEGCAAYMVDFDNVTDLPATPRSPYDDPLKTIPRTAYALLNQYHLVYSTPSQQPNGLPVVGDPAKGNPNPPTDGADLSGIMIPVSGDPPPSGDKFSYWFLPLSGDPIQLTKNFPYRCVATSPWSPVNSITNYPGNGVYPLLPTVCDPP